MKGPDEAFVKSLKAGDRVAVANRLGGIIYETTIWRITPTGLIKLEGGRTVFRSNGWQRDEVYCDRFLAPPPGETRM